MKTNLAKIMPSFINPPSRIHPFQHKKIILKNKLLSGPIEVINQTIQNQLVFLHEAVQKIMAKKIQIQDVTQIAKIFDQAANVFLALDDIKSAREICYSEIHLFIIWSYQFKDPPLFKQALIPWLNLAKMDRLEGNYDEALIKLTILNEKLKLSCLLERIKIYLVSQNYDDLIPFLKSQQTEIKHPIIQEALSIAYANTGKFFKALDLLAWSKSSVDSYTAQIFFLRECEINVSLKKNVFHDIHSLYSQTVTLLNNQAQNHHIEFGLQAAFVLGKAHFKQEAAQIAYYCLEASEILGDEFLKAKSLIFLNELITEYQGKNIVEDLMIKHYSSTQHVVARKKMLNEFPGLQHVERGEVNELSHLLFENLLLFTEMQT